MKVKVAQILRKRITTFGCIVCVIACALVFGVNDFLITVI